MDWTKAIQLAQLVNAAYDVFAGKSAVTPGYDVLATIYANDLATDKNPDGGRSRVIMGLVLQAQGSGNAVVAIRGTVGILEWVQDVRFGLKPFTSVPGAGNTEDGFTDMYLSMTLGQAAGAASVVNSLPSIPWRRPVTSLAICGHSLGGALVTLLALDVAANTAAPFNKPIVYTYASPKTGDPAFVQKYNQLVTGTIRTAIDPDLVPKLPPSPYEHVCDPIPLKAFTLIPPKLLVQPNPYCWHILSSYLHLMSLEAGGAILPPAAACAPPAGIEGILEGLRTKVSDVRGLIEEFASAAPAKLGGS